MLSFNEFSRAVEDNLNQRSDDINIRNINVKKLNGVQMPVLSVSFGDSNIGMNLPLNEMYEQYNRGVDINEICDEAYRAVSRDHMVTAGINEEELLSTDYFMSNVIIEAVNSEKNHDMLLHAPYKQIKGFNDIVLVGRLEVELPDDSRGTVLVTEDILQRVGVSAKEMFDVARENSEQKHPVKITTMAEVMSELTGMPEFLLEDVPPQYVVTNHDYLKGASVIGYDGIFDKIRETVGEDFYMLPSSVHEIIVIPKSFCSENELDLNSMVCEVNATVLDEKDFLSDNVFSYNSNTRSVSTIVSRNSLVNGNVFANGAEEMEGMRNMNEGFGM